MQFDYPRRRVGAQASAVNGRRLTHGRGDLSELATVSIGIREGEVRMIEQIKEPRANGKLSAFPLRYGEPLFKVEISVEITWATKLIPPLGSEVICWVGEICGAVTWVGQAVYQLCSRGATVDVGRAYDLSLIHI